MSLFRLFRVGLTVGLLLLGLSYPSGAQPPRHVVFAELGGAGPHYSLNYARMLRAGERLVWEGRLGATLEADAFSVPAGLQVYTAAAPHHLEVGLTGAPYVDRYRTFLAKNDRSDTYLYVSPSVGYRYQRAGGGLSVRIAFVPQVYMDPPSDNPFNVDPAWRPWAALSVGWGVR
ncbi:MAG: hypothetical protein WBA12_02065 [Catalinimonas sp.]